MNLYSCRSEPFFIVRTLRVLQTDTNGMISAAVMVQEQIQNQSLRPCYSKATDNLEKRVPLNLAH